MKYRYLFISLAVITLVIICTVDISAQCPMCRMSAESNLQDGGTAGKGLNAGILYMLGMPYLLVATLGYIWYRNKKSEKDDEVHKWN